MKRIAILILSLYIGMCYAYDIPAGVPTDIMGFTITSTANLNIRHDITLAHPAITALPHYKYLFEPIALGLEGNGIADIVVNANLMYPFVLAYYGSKWHKGSPYVELPIQDVSLDQVDFDAGSEVILFFCRNNPLLQVIFESFTAVYDETDPHRLTVSWTTSSETGLSGYKLFTGFSGDQEQAAYIYDVAATNTEHAHTYSYEVMEPCQGFTHYFWLKLVDNMGFGYFYGPTSVAVGPHYVLQNKVSAVIPNPNSGTFWCVYEVRDSSRVSILLLDKDDNIVKEICHNENITAGGHMRRLNYYDLPAGLYRIYYWFEQADGNFYAYGDVLIIKDEDKHKP